MANAPSKWLKKNKIIRDAYDGRIIREKEAISLRNISLIKLKEGYVREDEEP